MAYTQVRLANSVPATVIRPFGEFKENERVVVNRVTGGARMFGAAGKHAFLPSSHVDEEARQEVWRQFCEAIEKTGGC